MEPDAATALAAAWVARHLVIERPSDEAVAAVRDALALVPPPEAAAAVTPPDGRPRIAAVARGALYLVWGVQGSAGVREAARCRRIPLRPGSTTVEVSQRRDPGAVVRHWCFELDDDPLIFRTTGDDEEERFARHLAEALGWPG
jgi:hypothetical protein